MSQHEYDYDDVLRRALHAAAESVQPAGDGLERIRTRLTAPASLPVAWLSAAAAWLLTSARLATAWLLPATERAWAALGPLVERFKPAQAGAAARRYAWLRPAAATATAVAIVAMGALAVKELPQAISPAASNQSITGGQQGGQPGGSGVNGKATPLGSQTPEPTTATGPGSTTKPPCAPAKKPHASPSVSPSPSTSPTSAPPSPTPTPSATPSPTPSPSLTPTPSDSSSPGDGDSSPSADSQDAGLTAGPAVSVADDQATAAAVDTESPCPKPTRSGPAAGVPTPRAYPGGPAASKQSAKSSSTSQDQVAADRPSSIVVRSGD